MRDEEAAKDNPEPCVQLSETEKLDHPQPVTPAKEQEATPVYDEAAGTNGPAVTPDVEGIQPF